MLLWSREDGLSANAPRRRHRKASGRAAAIHPLTAPITLFNIAVGIAG